MQTFNEIKRAHSYGNRNIKGDIKNVTEKVNTARKRPSSEGISLSAVWQKCNRNVQIKFTGVNRDRLTLSQRNQCFRYSGQFFWS